MWWEYGIVFAIVLVGLLIVSRQFTKHAKADSDCKCGTGACQTPEMKPRASCGRDEDSCCQSANKEVFTGDAIEPNGPSSH
ncbi:MAG: hypothetical protein ACLFUJ_09135 [Phycisphaerae bacterium]